MRQPRLNVLFAPSAAAASARNTTQKNQDEENPDASAPFLDIQKRGDSTIGVFEFSAIRAQPLSSYVHRRKAYASAGRPFREPK